MASQNGRRPFYPANRREHLTSRYRLRDFDYATPGYYFLSLPVINRTQLLGRIVDGQMRLSPVGLVVNQLITTPSDLLRHLTVDDFVIMPNHVHLLIYISIENQDTTPSGFVKWLKGSSTVAHRAAVREGICPDIGSKLWQVGFHDEIVRNDAHLNNVRIYIAENVARWADDELF